MALKTQARRGAQQEQQESEAIADHGRPFSFDSSNARLVQRQCADPVLLKLRFYLNQLSIEGVTEPAECDKSVVTGRNQVVTEPARRQTKERRELQLINLTPKY